MQFYPDMFFHDCICSYNFSGLLIFREKKAKFRGIFRGKFAEKSADFMGFSREKRQNLLKNRLILQDFNGKKSNFEGFSGQILRKIGRFHGKFWGKLRQETISKKQPISMDFFGKFR